MLVVLVHGVSLSRRGSGRLDTRLDTPPFSHRHHPVSAIARRKRGQSRGPGWLLQGWLCVGVVAMPITVKPHLGLLSAIAPAPSVTAPIAASAVMDTGSMERRCAPTARCAVIVSSASCGPISRRFSTIRSGSLTSTGAASRTSHQRVSPMPTSGRLSAALAPCGAGSGG